VRKCEPTARFEVLSANRVDRHEIEERLDLEGFVIRDANEAAIRAVTLKVEVAVDAEEAAY
jgi:hypothetical protein